MPQHWIRGPSGTPRIMACPGCVNEQQKWPEEPSGKAAIDGTHSHTQVERCVINRVWDASSMLGQWLEDHEGKFKVDQARCDRVQVALDYVQTRLAIPGVGVYCEHTVDAGRRHGIPDWKGTSDLVLHNPSTGFLEVTDYKDGYKIVDPLGAQNISYMSGAIDSWPLSNFRNLRLGIIQPKNSANPVNAQDITRERFDNELLPPVVFAMQQSMNKTAPRVPGDHCKYCRGAHPGRCVEFNAQVTGALTEAFATIPAGNVMDQFNKPPVVPVEVTAPWFMSTELPLEQLTVAQLESVMDFAPMVIARLDEIKKEALKRSRNGVKIPHYKRVKTKGKETWDSSLEGEDLQKKLRNSGLKRHDYLKETVKTPKQILALDIVTGKGEFKDKGWTEKKLKSFKRLIEKNADGDKLVHETESGVEIDDSEMFEGLPEPDKIMGEFDKPCLVSHQTTGLAPGTIGPVGSNAPIHVLPKETPSTTDEDDFM